jgi:hypothetical protein
MYPPPTFHMLASGPWGCTFYAEVQSGTRIDYAPGCHPAHNLSAWFGFMVEGCPVVDRKVVADELGIEAWKDYALQSPVPDCSLTEVAPASTDEVVISLLSPDRMVQTLAQLKLSDPAYSQSADRVPIDVWAQWWQDHGARIGHRHGDKVLWMDGQEESIPPFDGRWS